MCAKPIVTDIEKSIVVESLEHWNLLKSQYNQLENVTDIPTVIIIKKNGQITWI